MDDIGQRLGVALEVVGHPQEALPPENVIRYEDICESSGRALSVIVPAAAGLDEPLENKNPLYDREKVLTVGEALLRSEGAYWNFYSKEEVREIVEAYT